MRHGRNLLLITFPEQIDRLHKHRQGDVRRHPLVPLVQTQELTGRLELIGYFVSEASTAYGWTHIPGFFDSGVSTNK